MRLGRAQMGGWAGLKMFREIPRRAGGNAGLRNDTIERNSNCATPAYHLNLLKRFAASTLEIFQSEYTF